MASARRKPHFAKIALKYGVKTRKILFTTWLMVVSEALAKPLLGLGFNDVAAAVFLYNLLASLYLTYLRFQGAFAGALLLPAAGLHILFAISMARSALLTFRRES